MLTQTQEEYREVLEAAENLYRQEPDWVTFFREVLGIDGVVRKRFPSFDDLSTFEQSDEFDKIQRLLVKLREKRTSSDPDNEPTRVITVRLPKSMHEYLRTEAHDLRTSMNKLCISKLLQVIAEEMIPNERTATASKPAAPVTVNHQPALPTPVAAPLPAYSAPQLQPQLQTRPLATTPFKPAQPRF